MRRSSKKTDTSREKLALGLVSLTRVPGFFVHAVDAVDVAGHCHQEIAADVPQAPSHRQQHLCQQVRMRDVRATHASASPHLLRPSAKHGYTPTDKACFRGIKSTLAKMLRRNLKRLPDRTHFFWALLLHDSTSCLPCDLRAPPMDSRFCEPSSAADAMRPRAKPRPLSF